MGDTVRYQLAFTEEAWGQLTALLDEACESAGVLTARLGVSDQTITFLGRTIYQVPDDCCTIREPDRLSIRSPGYIPALGRAADDGAVAIFFHTHPQSHPAFSRWDDEVDRQISELFIRRTRQDYFVSLVIAGSRERPLFAARVYRSGSTVSVPLTRLRVIGSRIRFFDSSTTQSEVSNQFDRQVRAFGRDGQRLLAQLHVGVVGAGGTGSAVCEQLIRLGVGHITVIDDDTIEETNLTRIHEAQRDDVRRPKVDVVAAAGSAIGSGSYVTPIRGKLRSQVSVPALTSCDVIFGCTDDETGRGILSRLAYWYLIPVFDMGFIIDSLHGRLRGLYGRITTLVPGAACLLCRGRITPQRMYYESLSPTERQERAREGYAPELGEPAPSVVTYTTLVATTAIAELLDRLFGLGSDPPPSELLLRVAERSISRTSSKGRPEHYCMDSAHWGLGDQDPMLGQTWPAS